jgi:hypothetical protein
MTFILKKFTFVLLYFLSGMIFILKESFLKKFKFVLLYRAFK